MHKEGKMAIHIELSEILKARRTTSKQLAKIIGITEANMSILRSGKAKAIKISTIDTICKALNCQPKDFICYKEETKNK